MTEGNLSSTSRVGCIETDEELFHLVGTVGRVVVLVSFYSDDGILVTIRLESLSYVSAGT